MILYFANRKLEILGQASTKLPEGLTVIEDNKVEDIETGVATFEFTIPFDKKTRHEVEHSVEVGNYVLRYHDDKTEFYTIIDAEINTKNQEAYIYAEDAGLDLLNEVVRAYAADKAYPISHYINIFANDSGFEIGVNEAASLTRKLSWDGESTAAERIASVATQFDGCEISYTFEIKGLEITKKYINIYKQRGKDVGEVLRLNKEVDGIITKKSIANLATALQAVGGTPENAEVPITFKGLSYDDGDFYIDGDTLKSRNALKKWSRYIWPKEPNQQKDGDGHIVRQYSYDTTNPSTLLSHTKTALKKACDLEVNYEIDIKKLPENVKIGDRVNIVDDAGETYISARVLKLETSVTEQTDVATLGEYLIKEGGIHQKVLDLAAQFAKQTVSVQRATAIANDAKTAAETAQEQAKTAAAEASAVLGVANEAKEVADAATESANEATNKANAAETAVGTVQQQVAGLEATVENANAAAEQARQAAQTAEIKATEAQAAVLTATQEAEKAQTAAGEAKTKADTAIEKAETAQGTAETAKETAQAAQTTAQAAKLDAEQANKDIDALGENLTTLSNTMSVDYARKTDLTEATANLQTQITQNAGEIASTASRIQTIDETANNAAELASQAQNLASTAQTEADKAKEDAQAAQTKADEAKTAATNAQTEADNAKAAAETAQSVADKAEADLAAAKADLETVAGRVDATEADILAAQTAVETAQAAADKAKTDATAAQTVASNAQSTADTAVANAQLAQTAANDAASKANIAEQLANEAKGNAATAQQKANEAAQTAATAQNTANTAAANALAAQNTADAAATAAANAQKAADDADAKAAQAEADLATAQQNLANVTSRVDATEEEVEAAKAAVETAQAAAEVAKTNAATAQATANQAKENATAAQTAATNAKTAADNAQKAADDAQAAADKAQEEVDALAVRVTSAETSITQNANEIALRATKTEVAQTLGGYYTKTETDAKISAKADEINLSVAGKIDAMQIGGRNLVGGTDDTTVYSGNIGEGIYVDLWYGETLLPPDGTEYIASFDAKADVEQEIKCFFYNPNTTIRSESSTGQIRENRADGQAHVTVTTEWQRYWVKWKQTPADKVKQVVIGRNETTNNVYIRAVKLEQGNKATDWTPAPEDVDTDIDNAQQAANNAQDSADGANERMTSAETVLQMLVDSISTLVRDGNGASLMTQTENGWSFSIGNLQSTVDDTSSKLNTVTNDVGNLSNNVSVIQQAVNDLGELGEYVRIVTYNGQPCLELGEGDSDFRLMITNTGIEFFEGSNKPAWFTNESMHIKKAVIEEELHQGGFVWKVRANGNLGLLWE